MFPLASRAPGPLLLGLILGGCGGSGGGGSKATLVAGVVRSPDGQVIGLAASGRTLWAGRPGRAALEVSGLLPVPDGTPVELVRVLPDGTPLETLAGTDTAAGLYSFDLSSLDLELASDLWVVAGSGATVLRAPCVRTALDVDPLSEALVGLALSRASLEMYTLDELADLLAGLELVARLEDLAALPDLAATIALFTQAGEDDVGWSQFLFDAAGPGQTLAGPGDLGDYFPGEIGDVWSSAGSAVLDGGPPQSYTVFERVVARAPDGTVTLVGADSRDPETLAQTLLRETDTGILYLGSDDPQDPLNTVVPFEFVRFPLAPGETWEQFDESGLTLGLDLDGDERDEVLDVEGESTLVAFEDLDLPLGTFGDCARFETRTVTTLRFTAGPLVRATLTQVDWFAPGLGPVRSVADLVLSGAGISSQEASEEVLASYQVDGDGRGILPASTLAVDVAPASSDQETPGRPGVGFDGEDYLVVTCRAGLAGARLAGLLVSATGLVRQETALYDLGAECGLAGPAVTFDGTNFLVVFQDEGEILAQRVSPAGVVLDPAGFPISTMGSSNFLPAVAFDGTNSLVVWRSFLDPLSGEIHAALITPGGSSLGEFPVRSAAGDQLQPSVVFGGGYYFVAWSDDSSGLREVRAARVTPDGIVLDATDIDLSPGTSPEGAVRVACDGDRYLAVWTVETPGSFSHLRAARVEFSGAVTDAVPLVITSQNARNVAPDVVYDGTQYLIAWEIDAFTAPFGIHAVRLSSDGVLLDGNPASGGLTVAEPGFSMRLVRPALARGAANALLAWIVNRELAGTTKDVAGALVYPF